MGTSPHSPQVTMRLAPRRLRKRILCSPASMAAASPALRGPLSEVPLPARSSFFMSAISTSGRACSLYRRRRVNRR